MFHMEQNKSPALMSGALILLRNCSVYEKVENV